MSPTEQPDPQQIEAELVDLIVQLSEGRLASASIDPTQHLYDCGYVDSLSAAPFLKAIQTRYGVVLKESQLIGRFDHVRALAEHLSGD